MLRACSAVCGYDIGRGATKLRGVGYWLAYCGLGDTDIAYGGTRRRLRQRRCACSTFEYGVFHQNCFRWASTEIGYGATRVGPETEEQFDDDFFETLNGVCNALDNVQVRKNEWTKRVQFLSVGGGAKKEEMEEDRAGKAACRSVAVCCEGSLFTVDCTSAH
eukprot:863270-Rhodomonas_salina.4